MLQILMQNLQLLYHNHQQQVDMENYMNYMLLNTPWGMNRMVAMATLRQGLLGCSSSLLLVYFGGSYSATYSPGICTTAFPAALFEQTR